MYKFTLIQSSNTLSICINSRYIRGEQESPRTVCAAEQRNEILRDLINKLQSPHYIVDKKCLLETLILSQQETEIDIELVRKLMP